MPDKNDTVETIDDDDMRRVSGGAATIAGNSSTDATAQMRAMLSQVGQSIQALAQNKNGGGDQSTMMMLMMMMMGGMGGGASGGAASAPPPPQPTYVSVNVGPGSGRG